MQDPKWRTWAILLDSREVTKVIMPPPPPPPPKHLTLPPPSAGGTTGPGTGRQTHCGPPPNGHRNPGVQAGRATLPPHGAYRGRPRHPVGIQPTPFLDGPPASACRELFDPREAPRARTGVPAQAGLPTEDLAPGTPRRHRWRPTQIRCAGRSRETGCPAPRGWPHANGRVLGGGAARAHVTTGQPPTKTPDPSLHPPFRDVVLSNAAVRAPWGGLTDGVGLPAVFGIPPLLGAPINRCGPAGRMA